MQSSKLHISQPAKAIAGTMGYMDRLLGTSARKMRTKTDNLGEVLNKVRPGVGPHGQTGLPNTSPVLEKIHAGYKAEADTLTAASKSTRIKTGLTLGAGAIAYKAMDNHRQNQANQYDYNQYYQQ